MAADTPLNRLVLSAASVADDLGYVALADLAHALGAVTADYRIIGGGWGPIPGPPTLPRGRVFRGTAGGGVRVRPARGPGHNTCGRLLSAAANTVGGSE